MAMFCSNCGTHVQDGDHFCNTCGTPLQTPGGIVQQPAGSTPPATPAPSRRSSSNKVQDPYKDQIQQLKFQIRHLNLALNQITTQMSNPRSGNSETAPFLQRARLGGAQQA